MLADQSMLSNIPDQVQSNSVSQSFKTFTRNLTLLEEQISSLEEIETDEDSQTIRISKLIISCKEQVKILKGIFYDRFNISRESRKE